MTRSLFARLRAAFLAGILVFVPLAVTLWVLFALVGFLEGAVHLLPAGWQPENLIGRPIPGLGIVLAFSTVLTLGVATHSFVGRGVINAYERLLARVPVVSSVYQGVKQLTEALFSGERGHFRQVVLVEWPRKGVFAVAFHTGESFITRDGSEPMVNVFLPTTPNPTSGFFFIVPESDIRVLDLTVEEAFKLIMSAGIVGPLAARQLTEEVGFADLPEGHPMRLPVAARARADEPHDP